MGVISADLSEGLRQAGFAAHPQHAAEPSRWLGLEPEVEARLIMAAADPSPVEGLTHRHYRYPARFSPVFVAAAIDAFTEPGDLVLDPFVGGGTTLVEAMASGRHAVGADISTLATFVSSAKTLVASDAELARIEQWLPKLISAVSMERKEPEFKAWADAGYFRNLASSGRWRIRKAIAQAVNAVSDLGDQRVAVLARCIVLRTAQWALETRREQPTIGEFRSALLSSGEQVMAGSRAFAAKSDPASSSVRIQTRSAVGIDYDDDVRRLGPPRLILTSPPYPGVHVLYHRWQVKGGKESAAPFFIADVRDGSGEAYYTMGGRKRRGLPLYFDQLERALRSLANLADETTTLVQVVAFAQPEWQLPSYLSAASRAGWEEGALTSLSGVGDGRLWRDVPNRRWYADMRGRTNGAREVVLIHHLRR